jgi:hypothetical protein
MAQKEVIEKYKSFEKWRAQEVEVEFALNRVTVQALPHLQNLLDTPLNVTENERVRLAELQDELRVMVEAWNEYDISIAFIGPLFTLLKLQNRTHRAFYNHTLTTILNGKEIKGRIDCMLAKGWQIPSVPLFFLQAYKPEASLLRRDGREVGDPIGQLLIEMIAAQTINAMPNDEPVYGCYIIGRNWYFTVLQGKNYAITDTFVATNEQDLWRIFTILKQIKQLFEVKIGFIK